MKNIKRIINYLNYRILSVNQYKVHSPFVFDLLTQIIYNSENFYAYKKIEALRNKLSNNKSIINHIDFGAGSVLNKNRELKINQILKNASKAPKYAQLLFRLVNHFQPNHILEFGTSLGISGAYLASGNLKAKMITMEGSPEIAAIAKKNFNELKLENVDVRVGNFDIQLPLFIKNFAPLDFVFFDGNHKEDATLNYFNQCLTYKNEQSVFVFDDIYWSDGMKNAWEQIKNHPEVSVSIDIFQMGIIFFRKEQRKQHFVIKY